MFTLGKERVKSLDGGRKRLRFRWGKGMVKVSMGEGKG